MTLRATRFQAMAAVRRSPSSTPTTIPTRLNDLNAFSAYPAYDLPQFNTGNGPTFQKINETGGAALPSPASVGGWAVEESLDIEWSHVMAPMANIILVEATSNSNSDLEQAVQTAASQPGVVVVSMSFSSPESTGTDDSIFATPSGHLGGSATLGGAELPGGVTFLASAGDSGRLCHGQHDDAADHAAIPGQFAQCRRGGRNQLVPQRQQLRQRDRLGQWHQ